MYFNKFCWSSILSLYRSNGVDRNLLLEISKNNRCKVPPIFTKLPKIDLHDGRSLKTFKLKNYSKSFPSK